MSDSVVVGGEASPGRAPWVLAGAAAAGCVALALVDPTDHQVTPPCPFRMMTGWWCPLCGGTRAVGSLVRADAATAFRFNAAVVLLLPVVVAAWVRWAFPGRVPAFDAVARRARPLGIAVGVALLAFLVLRNTALADHLRFPGA